MNDPPSPPAARIIPGVLLYNLVCCHHPTCAGVLGQVITNTLIPAATLRQAHRPDGSPLDPPRFGPSMDSRRRRAQDRDPLRSRRRRAAADARDAAIVAGPRLLKGPPRPVDLGRDPGVAVDDVISLVLDRTGERTPRLDLSRDPAVPVDLRVADLACPHCGRLSRWRRTDPTG